MFRVDVFYLAFRATFLVRHSKSSCLSFIRHSDPSPFPSILAFRANGHTFLGLLSHCFSLVLAFRAIFHTHSCILSHHLSLVLAFKAVMHTHLSIWCHCHSLVWRLEPLYILIQALWVTIFFSHFDVQSHSSSTVSFKVTVFVIHIHWHYISDFHRFTLVLVFLTLLPRAYRSFIALPDFPFHCTWHSPSSSRRHISVMLLVTLHLACSCSSNRVVSFKHILSCTPRWFDRYSSLMWFFKSLLETS